MARLMTDALEQALRRHSLALGRLLRVRGRIRQVARLGATVSRELLDAEALAIDLLDMETKSVAARFEAMLEGDAEELPFVQDEEA